MHEPSSARRVFEGSVVFGRTRFASVPSRRLPTSRSHAVTCRRCSLSRSECRCRASSHRGVSSILCHLITVVDGVPCLMSCTELPGSCSATTSHSGAIFDLSIWPSVPPNATKWHTPRGPMMAHLLASRIIPAHALFVWRTAGTPHLLSVNNLSSCVSS